MVLCGSCENWRFGGTDSLCLQCLKNPRDTYFSSVRFEVFTAVTIQNAVFWVMVLCGSCENWHFGGTDRLYLQCLKNPRDRDFISVRFEVFTALTMKNAVFWDMVLCGSCANWCFGGTYRLYLQIIKNPRDTNFSTVRFELFTAVTMKNAVFWDVKLCGYCKDRRFGGT
jgi:hypothetical protein